MVGTLCFATALTILMPTVSDPTASDPTASDDEGYAAAATHRPTSASVYQSWRERVSAALKDEATADPSRQAAAIRTLIDLEQQATADTQLTPRQRSQLSHRLRRRITHRLRRMEGNILAQFVGQIAPPDPDQAADVNAQALNLDDVVEQIIEPQKWEAAGGAGQAVLFQQGAPNVGGGGQNGGHNGEGLSELIQTVIAPDSWEAVGGHGVIAVFGQ